MESNSERCTHREPFMSYRFRPKQRSRRPTGWTFLWRREGGRWAVTRPRRGQPKRTLMDAALRIEEPRT